MKAKKYLRTLIEEQREKRKRLINTVRDIVERGESLPILKGVNLTYAIHPSTEFEGQFQITTYNSNGALGHTNIRNIDELISGIGTVDVEVLQGDEAHEELSRVAVAENQYQSRRMRPAC